MALPDGSRGNVVELRVHGVSGTPPEELLDRQLVRQVAGDKTAGFYRPRLREEWRDRPTNDPGSDSEPYDVSDDTLPPPLLEGYSWGGLTSGSPSRALWLILLPFTLINVAPRMRPIPGSGPDDYRRSAWTVWFLCRLMAVGLTVTITLGAVGVGLDILAWQCGGGCAELPWPLSAMFVDSSPGWRVLWGTVLPLSVLSVLAVLSWRKSVQYDLIRPIGMAAPVEDSAEIGVPAEPRLADPEFWYGRYPVSRLRHLHLQAGVGTVGTALVVSASNSPLRPVGLVLAGLIGLGIVAGLAWPGLLRRAEVPGDDADSRPTRMARYRNTGWILLIWLPVAGILLVGLLLPHDLGGEMPGYDAAITAWFTGETLLAILVFLLVAAMALRERPRTPRRAMGGMGTAVMTVLALYLGAVLTSGFVILSAAWITSSTPWIGIGDVEALLLPDSAIKVPDSLSSAGLSAFLVAVIVLATLLVVGVHAAWMWVRGGAAADRTAAARAAVEAKVLYPQRFARHKAGTIARRRTMISRAIWMARRVDYLSALLAALVLSIGALVGVLTLLYGFGVGVTGEAIVSGTNLRLPWFLGMATINAIAIGVWLIGVLAVGTVLIGAAAFRVPKTRKAVGILWDIGSFWPRDVHPLAPPCYAERAVPELAMRLAAHAAMVSGTEMIPALRGDGGDGPAEPPAGLVVLAGHSQGTVISMAALLGPGRGAARHTALLTFGTVLRRLYARFFPLYFSAGAFASLSRRLGEPPDAATSPWDSEHPGVVAAQVRWRNLWRRTDYLGGKVGNPLSPATEPAGSAGPDRARGVAQLDVEMVDPQFLPGRGDSTMPTAGRHSNFTRDPDFQAVLMRLIQISFDALGPATIDPAVPDPVRPAGPVRDDLMNPTETMV
ncbi:hypothetical protein ACVBEQ_20045 [Nakamurella sp. GG22]